MTRPPKIRSVRRYLASVPAYWRRRIYASSRAIRTRRGLDASVAVRNDRDREVLVDAIFEVEDDLESRCGGQPDHPTVIAMNQARCRVNVDLGWDDPC